MSTLISQYISPTTLVTIRYFFFFFLWSAYWKLFLCPLYALPLSEHHPPLRNQLSQIHRMYNCRKNGILGIKRSLWRRSYPLLFTNSNCLCMQNLHLVVIQPVFDLDAKWETHHPERSQSCWLTSSSSVIGLSSVPDWTNVSPLLPPVGLAFSSRQRTLSFSLGILV